MKKVFLSLVLLFVLSALTVGDTTSFTIYIVGDSTVTTYNSNAYPQTGWGQVIGSFFDASRVSIYNAALGGRSSKTFIQEGRLDALDGKVQKGDFLFIQFGHNDRYFGSKSREVPFDSLSYYLKQYIDKAKGWGATPVFVSPMMMNTYPRNVFSSKYSTQSEYDVRDLMESLARDYGIPFVDLNLKSYEFARTQSSAYISRYLFKYFLAGEYPNYPTGVTNDGVTHFQESGSLAHAEWILDELSDEVSANYLSDDSRSALVKLLSAAKKRYTQTVKTNLSSAVGIISHSQGLPGGAPLALHVSPGSFGKAFKYWADDDCRSVSTDSNFYGTTALYRNVTYTAIFEGGSACSPVSHESEENASSSSVETSSSQIASSSSAAFSSSGSAFACSEIPADAVWKSPIDMAFPNEGEGTTDENHAGFFGQGFFNIANDSTSVAVWRLVADQSASNARLLVRYANGGTASRPMKVTVDAGAYEVDFPPTGSWDTWDSAFVENVWIDALPFEFKMESLTQDGGPNIDMIAFDIAGIYREGCLPAEVPAGIVKKGTHQVGGAIRKRESCLYDVSGSCHSAGRKEHFSKGVYF